MLELFRSCKSSYILPVKDISRALNNEVFQLNLMYLLKKNIFYECFKNCEATRWNPLFLDVIPAGGGKHVAVEKIREYYGFSRKNYGFWRWWKYYYYILKCRNRSCHGNANENVKLIADYVTDSDTVDNDGILKLLNIFYHIKIYNFSY